MTVLTRKQQRQDRILALLRANPGVRVAELAQALEVSTETVRRDLDALGEAGLLSRTYGGAALPPVGLEPGVGERLRHMVEERRRIARLAVTLLPEGGVVMIDGGSTTIELAHRLAAEARRLTVVTNSLGVATALGPGAGVRVVLAPGDYAAEEGIVFGSETVAFLRRFHADLTLIGAGGLSVEGPSDVHSGAAWVKRAMLERGARRMLVLDHSKFEERRFERVCPLADLDDLVTDQPPPPSLRQALETAEVALHLA